jgi:hypothetical protein
MKNRGPIDFLAALVVEFGGLALLLAALPLLGGGEGSSLPRSTDPAQLPWPRTSNPTPWDDRAAIDSGRDEPAYVADRLGRRGEHLLRSLVGQVERALEDRSDR